MTFYEARYLLVKVALYVCSGVKTDRAPEQLIYVGYLFFVYNMNRNSLPGLLIIELTEQFILCWKGDDKLCIHFGNIM